MNQKECTGVEIKVPWGHISGKWWGPQTDRPILALHGWQDNAGTFDTLIPLLPAHIGVLAIDFPGHGLSSRLPDGLAYSHFINIYLINMIMKEYNWDKVSILGHSMGSIAGVHFAALYREKVDLLIGLDAYKPFTITADNVDIVFRHIIDNFLVADERNRSDNEPPSYSYEECIEKLYLGTSSSVDREKCPYLLERNVKKSMKYPDKYYFTRDSRMKYQQIGVWPHEINLRLAGRINSPFLYVRALDSPIYGSKEADLANINKFKENPLFEYCEVDGRHHVHLNEPEKVSAVINPFLMKYRPPVKAKL